jgi:hypothetical protein
LDRNGIAARLRGLIGGQEHGDLGAIAARLGVDEVSLRMSVDHLAPYPTLDVLAAIVVTYGVDPTWLLTGDYNPSTHRSVADASQERLLHSMREILRVPDQVGGGDTPPLRLLKDA